MNPSAKHDGRMAGEVLRVFRLSYSGMCLVRDMFVMLCEACLFCPENHLQHEIAFTHFFALLERQEPNALASRQMAFGCGFNVVVFRKQAMR